jgi:signal transduction histidine kinase
LSSIQFIRDGNGQIGRVVAIIRDVTERYSREKNLRAQFKALQNKTAGQA